MIEESELVAPAMRNRPRVMLRRDPRQVHRSATPLELFYDLAFVIAFSQTSSQAAQLLEHGHLTPAIGGFVISTFMVCWAWINYAWLASAFDNDDVVFRVATFVQMTGVIVLTLGVPDLFHSIDARMHIDNTLLVAGYVIIRIAGVGLWVRAARHNPSLRRTALTQALLVVAVQTGWIVMVIVDPALDAGVAWLLLLGAAEMTVPVIAARAGEIPWHPRHIAERYGLLIIVTLGEVVLGTTLSVSAVVDSEGWTPAAVAVVVGGGALALGLWWLYFTVPFSFILAMHRKRSYAWGYGHILLFAGLVGAGAGLHVASAAIRRETAINNVFVILAIVIPVGLFLLGLFTIYSALLRGFDPLQLSLFAGAAATLLTAVLVVGAGATLSIGIVVTAVGPIVAIIGYETIGYRHQTEILRARLR